MVPVFTIVFFLLGVVGLGVRPTTPTRPRCRCIEADAPWAPQARMPMRADRQGSAWADPASWATPTEVAPPVERQVALDMGRRALFVAPVIIAIASIVWGVHGGISAAVGLALAVANLLLAAVLLSWAAKVSLVAMAATALGGYILRLVLLTAVIFAIRHQPLGVVDPAGLHAGDHPPRPADLGDPLRVGLPCLPRPQAPPAERRVIRAARRPATSRRSVSSSTGSTSARPASTRRS